MVGLQERQSIGQYAQLLHLACACGAELCSQRRDAPWACCTPRAACASMAMATAADDVCPALVKERPKHIAELVELCTKTFKKRLSSKAEQLGKQTSTSFIMQCPLFFLNYDTSPIPGVYPLLGTVERVKRHFYNGTLNPKFAFPAPGIALEIVYFSHPPTPEQIGGFQRENCDARFFAWLLALKEATEEQAALFQVAAQHVAMRFNFRSSNHEKIARAYQLKEDEEQAADTAGHSVLARARALVALQEPMCPKSVFFWGGGICIRAFICQMRSDVLGGSSLWGNTGVQASTKTSHDKAADTRAGGSTTTHTAKRCGDAG